MIDQVIECHDCGVELKHLSLAEVARVADNPYAFILFCLVCQAYEIERLQRETLDNL